MKVTAKRERIAAAQKRYVCIVFCHWRKKWKTGIYFVTAHQKDGYFVGYNTIRNPTGPDIWGERFREFMDKKQPFGGVVNEIRDTWKYDPER